MVPTSMIVEMAGVARMATDSHDRASTDNCSADQECAGEIEDIPVCNDPSATFPLEGTAVASPYKNVESVFSSLMGELALLLKDLLNRRLISPPSLVNGVIN